MNVASFLGTLGDKLTATKTQAREIEALEFGAAGHDISVHVRTVPYGSCYPTLESILVRIGNDCLQQGIEAHQLRRISFSENEVRVDLEPGPHLPSQLCYPIEVRLGASAAPAPMSAAAGS